MAKGTTEDANARRVAVFRTVGGQRQAAAFDLTSIRRGEAPDPEIYPGDIIVVDGSSVKAVQKQVLQSIPLLAIFGPLVAVATDRRHVNTNLTVRNEGQWPIAPYPAPDGALGRGQRSYSAVNILDFQMLVRILYHWRWLVLGAIGVGLAGGGAGLAVDGAGLSRLRNPRSQPAGRRDQR